MMRAAWTALILLFTVVSATAGHIKPPGSTSLTVCSESMKPEYAGVHAATSSIFAPTGVRLEWRDTRHCPAGAVKISIVTSEPGEPHSEVLAYATPFEGIHIVVYLDRVEAAIETRRAPVLLAHILAHEIAHILQGSDYHSDSGLMKAHWDANDHREMAWQPLQFTPYDIDRIHEGMIRRDGLIANLR